jgi:excisionase family DNA binding protein
MHDKCGGLAPQSWGRCLLTPSTPGLDFRDVFCYPPDVLGDIFLLVGGWDMRTFTIAEAARLLGTSRSVLYRKIDEGVLTYTSGGGPGKTSTVTEEALRSAGFDVPPAVEHLERLPDTMRTSSGSSQGTSQDAHRFQALEQRLGHLERLTGRLEHELDLVVTMLKSLIGQAGSFPTAPPQPSPSPQPSLPARPRPLSQMRQQIVDVLRQHPEGMSPAQVRQALRTEKDLGDTMGGMARDGILTRVEMGRYMVSERR